MPPPARHCRSLAPLEQTVFFRGKTLGDHESLPGKQQFAAQSGVFLDQVGAAEQHFAEGLAVENHRLLELRDAAALLDQSVLPAEIINVSPDPHSRRVLLNRGSRHSVFAGQAVLEANGLMGQVVQVMPFTSWVLLITDPAHVTPIEVSRNGERALARGSQNGDAELDLEFVLPSQDIEVGDILISSGMGLVYPKNYPVAEVVSVNRSSQRPYATIRATPLARISSTRHVVLVLENAAAGIDGEAAGLASIEAAN